MSILSRSSFVFFPNRFSSRWFSFFFQCVRQYSINQLNSMWENRFSTIRNVRSFVRSFRSVPIRCPNGECNSLVSLNQVERRKKEAMRRKLRTFAFFQLENLFNEKQFELYKKLLVDHGEKKKLRFEFRFDEIFSFQKSRTILSEFFVLMSIVDKFSFYRANVKITKNFRWFVRK